MRSKDAHLYGQPRAKRQTTQSTAPTGGNLAFKSALSSLISKDGSSTTQAAATTGGRARSSAASQTASTKKDNIFTSHKSQPHKRRRTDDPDRPEYATSNYHAGLTADEWQRSKRAMEHKARLYAAMKRGDIDDDSERYAVDFDRKWAEQHPADAELSEQDSSASSSASDDGELVEYVDELGRTRRGTRAEAAREARLKQRSATIAHISTADTARPAMPTGVIYGDTIQAAAFEPDEMTAAQMAALAAKRDREPTPPEAVHFDGRAEIRTKGTGFFAFSKDEEEREAQMDALLKDRDETVRVREEKVEMERVRKEERRREVEERRRKIQKVKQERRADRFLESLGRDMATAAADSPGSQDAGVASEGGNVHA